MLCIPYKNVIADTGLAHISNEHETVSNNSNVY